MTAPANSGNSSGTTTTFAGAFADSKTSGTFALQTVSSGTATATLSFLGSGIIAGVSGTYNASTGGLTLSGNNYAFNGSIASGVVSGSFTGPNGTGNFSAQAPSSSGVAAKTYCGTYGAEGDYGWFNMVIGAAGNVTGLAVTLLGATSVGFSGTVSGSSLTAVTTANVQIQATLASDGSSLTGTYVPTGAVAGTGTFYGSTGGCVTAGPGSFAGLWATGGSVSGAALHFALTQSAGSGATGSGIITVSFVPGWSGDEFEVQSNSFTGTQLTFSATLGANPTGTGGFYRGTLDFSGTIVNGNTLTGTVTFTPPRTLTQTFAQQTVTGVTLTRY